jgi:hypothetical protein
MSGGFRFIPNLPWPSPLFYSDALEKLVLSTPVSPAAGESGATGTAVHGGATTALANEGRDWRLEKEENVTYS